MASTDWGFAPFSLSDDLVLRIAYLLSVTELCSLGSCSRYLRDVCASDSIWFSLFQTRWPSVDTAAAAAASDDAPSSSLEPASSCPTSSSLPPPQGWKKIYIRQHKKIAISVSTVVDFVKQHMQNDSIEIGDYLRAVEDLSGMGLGFDDVKLFLFNVKSNVMLNLIGLHHSMFNLHIPADDVNKALTSCQVSAREICVFSFRLGRWFFGFRLPDERLSHKVSLSELTSPKEEMIRSILNRGAVHEVLRVQITAVTSAPGMGTLPDPHNIS